MRWLYSRLLHGIGWKARRVLVDALARAIGKEARTWL